MDKILEINYEKEYAVVQPGLYSISSIENLVKATFLLPWSQQALNNYSGMAANDSSGIGSLLYGKTSNHLDTIKMVLSDGTVFDSHTLDSGDYDSIIKQGGIVSNIASTVKKIVTEKRELIKEVFPKLDRFMTGYNLFHALEDSGNINLNYIVSGSEERLHYLLK